MIPPPPRSTLFPYTTLFRSHAFWYSAQYRENAFSDDHHVVSGKHDDLQHASDRSEEHTSELQSRQYLVCRLLLEKKNAAPEPTSDPAAAARRGPPQLPASTR